MVPTLSATFKFTIASRRRRRTARAWPAAAASISGVAPFYSRQYSRPQVLQDWDSYSKLLHTSLMTCMVRPLNKLATDSTYSKSSTKHNRSIDFYKTDQSLFILFLFNLLFHFFLQILYCNFHSILFSLSFCKKNCQICYLFLSD